MDRGRFYGIILLAVLRRDKDVADVRAKKRFSKGIVKKEVVVINNKEDL